MKKIWFSLAGLVVIAAVVFMSGPFSNLFRHGAYVQYQNPVFKPVFADPSVIRGKDGMFYAYATEDDWGDGNGNRLIPIIRSKDLVHWTYVRDAFQQMPDWKNGGGFIWAPDISYHPKQHQYDLYYALSLWGDPDPGIGLAVSDKPDGPFTDKGKLFTSKEIGVDNSIDPQYIEDQNGTPYLFWGSFHGIYAVQLSQDGLHTVGKPVQIAGSSFEGTYIIHHNGYYYFFGSSGSCCSGINSTYHVMAGRSKHLLGPYTDQDGHKLLYSEGSYFLAGNTEPDGSGRQFIGPGHISIIRDDKGTDWVLYHAINVKQPNLPNGATKRVLMIDPILWKNGWPEVKDYEPSTGTRRGPYIK